LEEPTDTYSCAVWGYFVSLKEKFMEVAIWIEISEVAVGMAGIAYGYYEYRQRHKLSKAIKALTQAYPGDVAKIHDSCHDGWENTRNTHNEVAKMANSDEKEKALKFIGLAIGDARGGKDASINLFNQLLALQKGQFGSRVVTHPQSATLYLCKAEAESQRVEAEHRRENNVPRKPRFKFWRKD